MTYTNGKVDNSDGIYCERVDGEVLCQSKAIERYLGRRFNLMGANDFESAKVDSICECVRDFKLDYQAVRKLPESEREAGMKTWFSETLPGKLAALEHIVGNTHSVGTGVTLADIVLYSFLTQFFDDKESVNNAMNNTLKIKSVVESVGKLEGVQNWLNTRPETSF